MESVWIVDKINAESCDAEQVGKTRKSYEEAREEFAEVLKKEGLFEKWNGIECVYTNEDNTVSYVVRQIDLP